MSRGRTTNKRPFVAVNNGAVKSGDILFFFNANALNAKEQYDHVAICTAVNNGVPEIAHATFNATRTSNKVKLTDLRPYSSYLVFRHQSQSGKLAKKAVEVALKWSRLKVAYDFSRLKMMEDFLSSSSSLDHALKQNLQSYQQRGFLHSWKFASRLNQPFHPVSEHGFRCDQFVILCFQVAERLLFNQNQFRMQEHMDGNRVSMSHFNPSVTQAYSHDNKRLLSSIEKPLRKSLKKTKPHFRVDKKVLPLSMIFNREIGHVDQLVCNRLPLNPKVNSPSVFLHYLTLQMWGGGGGYPVIAHSQFKLMGVILGRDQSAIQFPQKVIIPSHEIRLRKRQGVSFFSRRDFSGIQGRDQYMHEAIEGVRHYCLFKQLVSQEEVSQPKQKRRRLRC